MAIISIFIQTMFLLYIHRKILSSGGALRTVPVDIVIIKVRPWIGIISGSLEG